MHRRRRAPAARSPRRNSRWRCAPRTAFLSSLALATVLVATPVDAGGVTFRDPGDRVLVEIPDGWMIAVGPPADNVVVALVAPTGHGTFALSAEPVPTDTTLDRYASDAAVRSERGREDATALPTTAVSRTLGGEPARAAVYAATEEGMPVFLYQVVALHGGVAYTLTFATAPEEKETYFARARTLLDTFTFLAAMR